MHMHNYNIIMAMIIPVKPNSSPIHMMSKGCRVGHDMVNIPI